jgi:hypothetical protein
VTIEEHIAEAERLLALAADHQAGQQFQSTTALAEAHLHAAEILHLRQVRDDTRQQMLEMKANSAFMTDLVGRIAPQEPLP